MDTTTSTNLPIKIPNEITFVILQNPLDLKETIIETRDYEPDTYLYEYIGDLQGDWVITRNSKAVTLEETKSIEVWANDMIILAPVPRGGAFGSILRIVAFVGLAILSFGGAGFAGLAGSLGGWAGFAAGTAAFIGGSMIINALLGPTIDKPDGFEQSITYGIDGPKNQSTAGIPVPVVIGPYRMGGNYIALHTTNGEMALGGYSPIQGDWTLPTGSFSLYDFTESELNAAGYSNSYSGRGNQGEQFLYGLICAGEGEIEGITDIEINDQPIGNFTNAEWALRYGVNAQSLIGAFNAVYVPVSVGVTMDTADIYTTRTTSGDVDRIRIDFLFPSGMFRQRSSGDRDATTVDIWVEYRLVGSGTWLNLSNGLAANGVSNYHRVTRNSPDPVRVSFFSQELPRGTYEVRAKRNNEPTQNIVRNLQWTDLVEIQDSSIQYNYTALFGFKVKVDDQIHSIPKITFVNRGIHLRNWNESTQAWQTTHSNNPAWVVWNMMTNVRWGGGIPEANMDLFAFREWAENCEAENIKWVGVFDQSGTLWDQLKPVLRVGRASLVRMGQKYTVSVEKQKSITMTFNNSNIIEGSFSQSWTSLSDRANEVHVTYFDADDGYRPKTTKVVDQTAQDDVGEVIQSRFTLYGVDNLEQAQREGQYALNLNALTNMIYFESPMEAVGCLIGDLVNVQHDQPEFGDGGRCLDASTTTSVNIDREVDVVSGTNQLLIVFNSLTRYSNTVSSVSGNIVNVTGLVWGSVSGNPTVAIINGTEYPIRRKPTGAVEIDNAAGISPGHSVSIVEVDAAEIRTVNNGVGPATVLTVSSAFPQAPSQYDKWVYGPLNQNVVRYTVREIKETDDGIAGLTLLEYNPNVFTTDPGTTVVPYSYTTTPLSPVTLASPPVYQELLADNYTTQTVRVIIAWTHTSERYRDARVMVSRNGGPFRNRGYHVSEWRTRAEVGDELRFVIVPRSVEFIESSVDAQTIVSHTVVAMNLLPPADPTGFAAGAPTALSIPLSWDDTTVIPGNTHEIYWIEDSGSLTSSQKVVGNATRAALEAGNSHTFGTLSPDTEYTFWIRTVRTLDMSVTSNWVGGTNGISVTTALGTEFLNAYTEWRDIQNREVRAVAGANVNDWNIAPNVAAAPIGAGDNSIHIRLDRVNNRAYVYLYGESTAGTSSAKFELEVLGATVSGWTNDGTYPPVGLEIPTNHGGAIDFSAPPADNRFGTNGMVLNDSVGWGTTTGTDGVGGYLTLDSLTEDVEFRLRITQYTVNGGDRARVTFGDTVAISSGAETAIPIEYFFASRDGEDYDALRLTNGPAEPGATNGATWGANISGQPPDSALLNALQEWQDIQNREVHAIAGANINDWNIRPEAAGAPIAAGDVSVHVALDRATNRAYIWLYGESAASASNVKFELEVLDATVTGWTNDGTYPPSGAEVPTSAGGAINFASPPTDNVWGSNGLILNDTNGWAITSGTDGAGGYLTLDALENYVEFRLRVFNYDGGTDNAKITFSDTVIVASGADNGPLEFFFAARDGSDYDALILTNGPAEPGATAGAGWNINIGGQPFWFEDYGDNNLSRVQASWPHFHIGGGWTGNNGEVSLFSSADPGVINPISLRIGDNTGNDGYWNAFDSTRALQIVPGKVYRMSVIARQTQGSHVNYAGVIACRGDVRNGNAIHIHPNGTETSSSLAGHYLCYSNITLPSSWTRYDNYFMLDETGETGAPLYTGHAGTLADPKRIHANAEYVIPMFIANYNGGAQGTGQVEFNFFEIVEVGAHPSEFANDYSRLNWMGGSINPNGDFNAAILDSNGLLKPLNWYRRASGTVNLANSHYYPTPGVRDTYVYGSNTNTGAFLISEAFAVNTEGQYEIVIRWRRVNGDGTARIRIGHTTGDLTEGKRAIYATLSGTVDAEIQTDGLSSIALNTSAHSGTAWRIDRIAWNPTTSLTWASIALGTNADGTGGTASDFEVDYCFIRQLLPVTVTVTPSSQQWVHTGSGGWSPNNGTTTIPLDTTFVFFRGNVEIARRVIRGTLDTDGGAAGGEGDIGLAVQGTPTGETTSHVFGNHPNTSNPYATVTHTASGVAAVGVWSSTLPGQSTISK